MLVDITAQFTIEISFIVNGAILFGVKLFLLGFYLVLETNLCTIPDLITTLFLGCAYVQGPSTC